MFPRQQRSTRRCARLYPVLLVAIALIVFAVPSIASADAFSEVALLSRWGPHIYGQQYPPLAPVTVTVSDSEGIQKGSAESSVTAGGRYMFFEEEILAMDANPIELRRGDLVTVTIGTGDSATVVEIKAELAALFSSTQNKIFVEALPNQAIGVFRVAGNSFVALTQGVTDAGGKLVLNQAIPPNELFYVMSADTNTNFTSLEVWPAYGMVTLSDDSLWGSGFISDSTATVEVYNGATMLADADVMTMSDGSFYTDDFSPEIDIVSGNTIKLVSRYETIQFIANLEADMDYVDDTILGKTTPYSYMVARIAPAADPSSSFDETATASSNGAFAINAVMDSGDSIWLASIHPDGNITQTFREFGTSCYSHGNPVIFANKQNQNAGAVSIDELGPRSISSHAGANEITLNIQTAGVTFSSPPQATCDGVALDSELAALSSDRRTATWTVSECTTQTTGSIMIDDINYDAGAGTPDGEVALAVGGNAGVTAGMVSNAIVAAADTTPTTTISFEPLEPDGKNGWYVTETTITLSANETATIHYQWDGATTQTSSSPVQFTALEGEHTLTYFAANATNNTETARSTQVKVDTEAPNTPMLESVDTITASNVASVFVGGLAETDTVVYITASDGTDIIETTTTSDGTFGVSLDLSSLEDTDTVVFTAQAEDQAGNKSAVSLAKIALKDTARPEVDSTDPASGATGVATDTAISVTFSEVIETGTAFGGITLGYESTTTSPSAYIETDTVNIPLDSPLAYETTYTVTIPAAAVKDGVGNDFETAYMFSFRTIDITTPETTLTVDPEIPDGDDGWYETMVTVTLIANEQATIHYRWDSEATQTAPSPVQIIAPEGEHTLTYHAVDRDGNIEEPHTRDFKVDALAPITTITADPLNPNGKNGWYVTTPTVELSVDETATIYYQWDAETTQTSPPSPVQFTAPEGEHILTAYAIDTEDDNDTGTPVSRLFKVDLTDPSQPTLDTVATITASGVETVIVNGTTDTDTVVHILATDGSNEVTATATASGSGFTTTMDLTFLDDTDTVVFTAYAEDEAGNESSVSEPVEAFKDATRPMVIATSPSADATDVARDALIVITLSEPIEEGAEFAGISLETTSTTIPIITTVGTDTIEIDSVSALSYGTVYTITVPAAAVKDGVGNEFAANYIFSFATEADIVPPIWSSTSTLIASEIGQTSVKLSWAGALDNVGVTGFRIYSGVGSVHHATVAIVDSTTVTGLTPGTQYTFTIQARDAAGNWSGEPSCGPSVAATTASSSGGGGGGGGGGTSDAAPAAPKDLKVLSTQNMIRLGWTANTESDLAGYNVYRKVKDASGSSTKLNSARITGVEHQDTTAQLGVVYVYYVTAVDNGNNESQKSNEVEAAVTIGPAGSIFFDVRPGDWFASFVSRLASLNIIGGYPDKSFRPHQNLTRAEFAKMLCLAMGWELQDPSNPSFSDVAREHWSYRYVETAKARGALGGYPTGEFRPGNSITRAEIAAAIARALNLSAGGSDLTDIALHWAKDQINACVQAGIISGYPGNVFRPNANATRAEASKMIAGVLDNK